MLLLRLGLQKEHSKNRNTALLVLNKVSFATSSSVAGVAEHMLVVLPIPHVRLADPNIPSVFILPSLIRCRLMAGC